MAKAETPAKVQATYTKSQLLKSAKYQRRRDLLASILSDSVAYTFADVDALIAKFDTTSFTERKGD